MRKGEEGAEKLNNMNTCLGVAQWGEAQLKEVRRGSMVSTPACLSLGPGFESWPGHPGGPFAEQMRLGKTEWPPYISEHPVWFHSKIL